MKRRIPGRFHPGEYIEDERKARNMSVTDLALVMNIKPARLTRLRRGQERVDRDIAERLADVFGTRGKKKLADFWLNLQKAYDEGREK